MRIIDISQPLFTCALFPGDAPPSRDLVKTVAADGYNLTNIALCVHNGTHIDAPAHFIEDGAGVCDVPIDIFFGDCVVTKWSGAVPEGCERLLLKGDVIIDEADAKLIVAAGVRLIGVESQSVGAIDAPKAVHMILLCAGVIPLEGLALSRVEEGAYTIAAFPLNLGGIDGSPVRAVLIDNE